MDHHLIVMKVRGSSVLMCDMGIPVLDSDRTFVTRIHAPGITYLVALLAMSVVSSSLGCQTACLIRIDIGTHSNRLHLGEVLFEHLEVCLGIVVLQYDKATSSCNVVRDMIKFQISRH